MKHLIAIVILTAACGGPAKPAVVSTPSKLDPIKVVAAPDLSSAEGIIEAAIARDGGRAAAEKIKSIHMTGTITLPQLGAKGTIDAYSAPPNSTVLHMVIPNLMKADQGVLGDLVWTKDSMQGVRLVTGLEKAAQLRESTFNADLAWKTLYPKVELKGVVKFADQDCYQIVLAAADGQAQTRYYAKATLDVIGIEMVSISPMGKIPVKVTNSDFRLDNGVRTAHKSIHDEGGQQFESTIDKFETNVAIPAGTFDPPDDVKALAAKAK